MKKIILIAIILITIFCAGFDSTIESGIVTDSHCGYLTVNDHRINRDLSFRSCMETEVKYNEYSFYNLTFLRTVK